MKKIYIFSTCLLVVFSILISVSLIAISAQEIAYCKRSIDLIKSTVGNDEVVIDMYKKDMTCAILSIVFIAVASLIVYPFSAFSLVIFTKKETEFCDAIMSWRQRIKDKKILKAEQKRQNKIQKTQDRLDRLKKD